MSSTPRLPAAMAAPHSLTEPTERGLAADLLQQARVDAKQDENATLALALCTLLEKACGRVSVPWPGAVEGFQLARKCGAKDAKEVELAQRQIGSAM